MGLACSPPVGHPIGLAHLDRTFSERLYKQVHARQPNGALILRFLSQRCIRVVIRRRVDGLVFAHCVNRIQQVLRRIQRGAGGNTNLWQQQPLERPAGARALLFVQ